MHRLRNFRKFSSRGFAGWFAAALALSAAAPVVGGEPRECFSIDGDFDGGLAIWKIVTQPSERGDADASATIEIVDASEYKSLAGDHPFDAATLQIAVSAVAGLAGGAGAAESGVQMSMVTSGIVGDVLQFEVGGGFEHQFLGGAGHGVEVIVDADGPLGGHVSQVIYSDLTPPSPRCGLGLAILGTLDDDPATVTMDLESGGIFWGEYITITIRVKAVAEATLPCQSAISQAVVLLDNFRICKQFSLYDLNEDGQVNGFDLALLLSEWGPCPVCPAGPCPCPADFDFSGDVDGMDLAALLAFWG